MHLYTEPIIFFVQCSFQPFSFSFFSFVSLSYFSVPLLFFLFLSIDSQKQSLLLRLFIAFVVGENKAYIYSVIKRASSVSGYEKKKKSLASNILSYVARNELYVKYTVKLILEIRVHRVV